MEKRINLALQGGGSHGTYTWGVLDRLLEEENLRIDGVSGTSAGAMNAAVMCNGYAVNSRQGAKDALAAFWRAISDAATLSPLQKTPIGTWLTGWNLDYSPAYYYMDMLSRVFSPYELNPMNLNPLRTLLDAMVDTAALNGATGIKLFVAATHVESGHARVFHGHEITTDVLLASACIPFLFQAVNIEGEDYWDGGYMGNPVIWPLIYHTDCRDVLLVQINPLHREGTPRTAMEIINRMNEITFNSSLIAEMRAIEFVQRQLKEGNLNPERYRHMNIHLVYSPEEMKDLNASSKMNAGWDFFRHLHGIGYAAADRWLKTHWSDIGVRCTLDIREKFLRNTSQRRKPKPKQ